MVIRTASSRIKASVHHITAVKSGQYGEYVSVLFKGEGLPINDRGEPAIWRSCKLDEAYRFAIGQQLYLVPTTNKQGKPSWDIELIDSPAPTAPTTSATPITQPAPQQGYQGMPDQLKRDVALYVQEQAKMLRYCWEQANIEMPEASEETRRCMTSSLFISAQRRFNLS